MSRLADSAPSEWRNDPKKNDPSPTGNVSSWSSKSFDEFDSAKPAVVGNQPPEYHYQVVPPSFDNWCLTAPVPTFAVSLKPVIDVNSTAEFPNGFTLGFEVGK